MQRSKETYFVIQTETDRIKCLRGRWTETTAGTEDRGTPPPNTQLSSKALPAKSSMHRLASGTLPLVVLKHCTQ